MKRKLIRILSLLLILVLTWGILSGCMFLQFEGYNPNDGYDNPDDGYNPDDNYNPDDGYNPDDNYNPDDDYNPDNPNPDDPKQPDPDNPDNPDPDNPDDPNDPTKPDPDDPDDPTKPDPIEPDPQPDIDEEYQFIVTCANLRTGIRLSGIGYYGDTATLVYLKPYEYLYGETQVGISNLKAVTPTVVSQYKCCTRDVVNIPRVTEDGYDTVYCKFYVVDDGGGILAGPIYPTQITPQYDHDEVVKANGIKGIFTDWGQEDYILDLNCEHTETNFFITGMIVPNERYEDGRVIPIKYEETRDSDGNLLYIVAQDAPAPYNDPQYVEEFWHNGTKYYFRTEGWHGSGSNLKFYDNLISWYTRHKIKATMIVLLMLDTNQYIQPYFLSYPDARSGKSSYYAVNTSNQYGAEYWSAFMKFIALRYSQETSYEDAVYGTVETWVMGNEIDQSRDWNYIVDLTKYQALTVQDYTVEYERMLRITNQSFRTAYSRVVPLIPITHWWNGSYAGDYKPKQILEIITEKTRKEGNYNWGLAVHPYGADLPVPNFWSADILKGVNGTLDTQRITWTNLEMLQVYLQQPSKMCNGQIRDVYVTEGGVSSGDSESGMFNTSKMQQAAGIAYAYYKCTQIPCIKAMNYYRLMDHPYEIETQSIYFGLITAGGTTFKPSYYVYKYIDTQYSFEVTEQYLEWISWGDYDENGKFVGHGSKVTPGFTWRDAMSICKSDFNWYLGEHWDMSKVIVRYIDEALEI